jgi:maleate isomerase
MNNTNNPYNNPFTRKITGGISGKTIFLPDVNQSTLNTISSDRFVKNGELYPDIQFDNTNGFPDSLSFKRKFGLLIPVTNTVMEHELWRIIFNNQGPEGLDGVGIHTANIQTPGVNIQNEADLAEFKNIFINGLNTAINQSLLAQPEYLIMGMSLEHILYGIDELRSLMDGIAANNKLSWATWHDAADAALKKYKAKRIGLMAPFIKKGNDNAIKMFEDLGYEVVVSFGFGCGDLVDIAHIPDSLKEEVIIKHLATPENKLDAILQLGTNMSMVHISEKLESEIGIPILGINAVTFWYALRENGFQNPIQKASRLLREF